MPVIITAKREGFRRCGVAHPAHAVKHPDGRWTATELAVLKAEPMLVVEVAPCPETPAKGKAAAKPEAEPAAESAAEPGTEPETKPAGKEAGK